MTDPTPPIEVLRAAREWAAEHRHPYPDDRMLAIVYAAGVAAGRTAAAADIVATQAAPCGCPITVEQMRMCRHTDECVTREQADRLSAAIEEYARG